MQIEKPDLTIKPIVEIRQIVEDLRRWYDRASLAEQIAWHRSRAIRTCRNNRKILKLTINPSVHDYASSALRRGQMRLLRIRTWRATGVYPGEG